MKKILYLTILYCAMALTTHGQILQYGIVDTSDLKLPSCDFEKGANAEVLFDYARVHYNYDEIIMERHQRIKIFNDHGKDEANIRLEFLAIHHDEKIYDVEAETVNLDGKTITTIPVDQKQIFTQVVDKSRKAIVFTFPDIKAGSVIEFKYKWWTPFPYNYPDWVFQRDIPTRYSQLDAEFNNEYLFKYLRTVHQPMALDTVIKVMGTNRSEHQWALANIESYKTEPYVDYPEDYLENVRFRPYNVLQSWPHVGTDLLADEDFGKQLNEKSTDWADILAKAGQMQNSDDKIAFLFNTVKKQMKWDKTDRWFTIDGVKKAWNRKTGNATEINLILYNLLRLSGIKTSLLVLSTRDNGKLEPVYPSTEMLNRTVVYCPHDSSNYYVLDASDPLNSYNDVPTDLTGLKALMIDPDKKSSTLFDIKIASAREIVFIEGELNADGLMTGTSQVSSSSYSKEKYLEKYDTLKEKEYIRSYEDNDKKLKILSLKMENMDIDTLPLIQTIKFNYKAADPDGDYLYLDPNVFTSFEANPFLSERRVSNIDFGCMYLYTIIGRYKIPRGFRVDALPKSVNMEMPDKGIRFRRVLAADSDLLMVKYTIDFERSSYPVDEYSAVRDFFKKMYEMLNEQIVLKKAQ